MREATITRRTAETEITLYLNLDGTGKSDIDTGVGFLDHMLTLFASHGRLDLNVKCEGDTYVDDHRHLPRSGFCRRLGRQAGHLPLRQYDPAHG